MGLKDALKPCDRCKHNKLEQVDQFGYVTYCDKKMPEDVYYNDYGCYKFKKKKGDSNR